MFKYILSYFSKPSDLEILSLEEAYNILSKTTECEETINEEKEFTEELGNFEIFSKVGHITKYVGGIFTIDDIYKFKSERQNFIEGSKVTYKLFISGGEVVVNEVVLIENDWDVLSAISNTCTKSTWCSRTLVCKVDKKTGRELVANPGNIEINLNTVASEFVPTVGDWVQLDVKCEIDENITDLTGKVLEVSKVYPLRTEIKSGSISLWDPDQNYGIINNNIYFNRSSFDGGYIPVKGDKVIAEIIESNQGRCAWRVLKMVPEFLKSTCSSIFNGPNGSTADCYPNIDGISINETTTLEFNKLNFKKDFTLTILNKRSDDILLEKVLFLNNNSQCQVLSDINNVTIKHDESLNIICQCISKNVGESRELLLFTFDVGQVGRWIDINVHAKEFHVKSTSRYSKDNLVYQNRSKKNDIIKGQKVVIPPRFIAAKCPDYTMSERLLKLVTKYKDNFIDNAKLQEELLLLKPCLANSLNLMNYLDKFHTMLYLEEIQHLISISTYDQDKTCFIRNSEYLMLEIENLSERRPSIIVGDRIYASDPYCVNKTEWEGFVHKLGAKHIYLKFAPVFHETYNGEDYSVHVESSRTAIRRLHHAVDLAFKNLGNDFLFPSKVNEKLIQVSFKHDDYSNLINGENNLVKAEINERNTPRSKTKILKMLKQSKNNNSADETNNRQLKLEWYNKNLNYYQKEAVRNIMLGVVRPLPYFIFGPPGTGKTVTLIEVILQILRLIPSSRLLVTAPSNSAADILADRLIDSGVLKPGDLVRLVSHTYVSSNLIPAKLAPYCATADVAKEGTTDSNPTRLDSGLVLGYNSNVLGRHRITISTCSSAGTLYMMGFPKGHFTHVIVDEAGQAMEPEVMIPLAFLDMFSGQAILAGDPLQLGPVVMSRMSEEFGLNESYLERLLNRFPYLRDDEGFPLSGGYDPRLITKLRYNYRSLPKLLKLTSSLFYNDDLIPTLSLADSDEGKLLQTLKDILPRIKGEEVPCIVFHGVNGENFQTADSPSWFNPSEAAQVFYYMNEFYRLGLKAEDIGIISPYVKQVKEIRALLVEAEFDIPKIGSVEECQGQEYNVIVLSTVRSNTDLISSDIQHSLGFVASPRRLNVAVSRAKSLLIIVGNPNLLYHDKYWQTIIDYCIEYGTYVGCQLQL